MTPIVQIMIGMGVGIVGALLLAPFLFTYSESHFRGRNRRDKSEYFSPPGQVCPICLETMKEDEMQYLSCGHAMHDECLREARRRIKHCPHCRASL